LTLRAHPGWHDVKRRRKSGDLTTPYLSSSTSPLLVLPAAMAKHYPEKEQIKTLAAEALSIAVERHCPSLVFLTDAPSAAYAAAEIAEGLALSAYRFDKYKKNKKAAVYPKITIVAAPSALAKARAAIRERLDLCKSVNSARDLINEPGSVATPDEIERRARAVSERWKLSLTVLDAQRLKAEGYEGLLSVGRGADVPPRMIVLSYKPRGGQSKIHLGLLGKGVTFDSGGVSIKPSDKMWQMKGDMSGAAAVLYALEAIARAKIDLTVTAIIVTTQNYVDARAIVPGDIMRGRNGKTVHIDNTDAEGRLILTDGLWRAGEEKVTHLVDVATLTGSIVRALGDGVSGAFGNDKFVEDVVKIAGACGEPCWKMPLLLEYGELLKCDVADLNNIGSTPNGGAITAALFLHEFVPEGVSWAHLDVAGTFLAQKKKNYLGPGATGVMVRTLSALAASLAEKV
jgi:leucyl aminopeptidase